MDQNNRPCDRCGATHNEYSDDPHPLCGEVQITHQVLAWICLNCRIDWYKQLYSSPEYLKSQKSAFLLDAWQMFDVKIDSSNYHQDGVDNIIQYGLQLHEQHVENERNMLALARKWLAST